MNVQPELPGAPWYRHFWPWAIIGLLATSVAAGVSTVVIAFANRDSLVRDDWYKEGTAINRRIEKAEVARRLAISARARVSPNGAVALTLAGTHSEQIQSLQLDFSHPTQASRDFGLTVERSGDGAFEGRLPAELSGRWYVTLAPRDGAEEWKIRETFWLPSPEPLRFGDSGAQP